MDSKLGRVVAIAILIAPGLAWGAGPTAADRETARTYMSEGRKKRDENDLKPALRAFEAADALMHVPTTGFEVAKTQAMLGQLVEARDRALAVARSAPQPGDPAPFAEARDSAKKLADDLEGRIPSIRITLKNAQDGASVSIDGAALPAIAIGLPRKLDPGSHVVVVKMGSAERKLNVEVLERESKDVPIDWSAMTESKSDADSHESRPKMSDTAPPHDGANEHGAKHGGAWTAAGVISLAFGGAGIALGAIAGGISMSQTGSIQSQCTNTVCPPTLNDGSDTAKALSSARSLATVSDIGLIAGGVLAAAGIVFVVVGASHGSKSAVAIHAGPGSVMLSGTF